MNSNEIKRVRFKKKPLVETVCQLRFPPILRIDTEIPSAFQENIRKLFPIYNETTEIQTKVNLPNPDLQNVISNPITQTSTNKNHIFLSEDSTSRINLTRNFIALTDNNYDTWEAFYNTFRIIISHFETEYKPQFYSRIGLRYINVIVRSKIGLDPLHPWSNLIEKPFLGLLSSDWEDQVGTFENTTEIRLQDKCMTTVKSLLVKDPNDLNNEICFMLDFDLYKAERTDLNKVEEVLNYLHNESTIIVYKAIKDKLYNFLGPELL